MRVLVLRLSVSSVVYTNRSTQLETSREGDKDSYSVVAAPFIYRGISTLTVVDKMYQTGCRELSGLFRLFSTSSVFREKSKI